LAKKLRQERDAQIAIHEATRKEFESQNKRELEAQKQESKIELENHKRELEKAKETFEINLEERMHDVITVEHAGRLSLALHKQQKELEDNYQNSTDRLRASFDAQYVAMEKQLHQLSEQRAQEHDERSKYRKQISKDQFEIDRLTHKTKQYLEERAQMLNQLSIR